MQFAGECERVDGGAITALAVTNDSPHTCDGVISLPSPRITLLFLSLGVEVVNIVNSTSTDGLHPTSTSLPPWLTLGARGSEHRGKER